MDNPASFIGVFLSAIVLGYIPGPTNLLVLDSSIRISAGAAFKVIAGAMLAVLLHITFATIGLSKLLASNLTAFSIVKLIGALFLAWIAYSMWTVKNVDYSSTVEKKVKNLFISGFAVNFFNPKVFLFFIAILPQVSDLSTSSDIIKPSLFGFTFMLAGFIAFSSIALAGVKIKSEIEKYSKVYLFALKLVSIFFIFLAIRILAL